METGLVYAEEAKVAVQPKKRKMNWFKKMITSWVREDWEHAQQAGIRSNRIRDHDGPIPTIRASDSVEIEGLSFKVMPAHGGVIVQMRKYNRKIDTENYTTYIIPEGEDVAERVGQIVSMELLRH